MSFSINFVYNFTIFESVEAKVWLYIKPTYSRLKSEKINSVKYWDIPCSTMNKSLQNTTILQWKRSFLKYVVCHQPWYTQTITSAENGGTETADFQVPTQSKYYLRVWLKRDFFTLSQGASYMRIRLILEYIRYFAIGYFWLFSCV